MSRITPQLSRLMFKGYYGGLRWETKGHNTFNIEGDIVHRHHFLLHHPHSTHLAKIMFRNIGTHQRRVISDCLSDIYNFAADNVHLCGRLEPQEFWAHAKNSWEWSAGFRDDAFWAFTYKLFHARALYLDTVPKADYPESHPLVAALDNFYNSFYELYDPDTIAAEASSTNLSSEAIEDVEDEIFLAKQTISKYFEYSQVDSEGDGTDHIVETVAPYDGPDPRERRYRRGTKPPEELTEDNIGFYIDLGPNNPRHGHRDAYQEIEEALKQADEEEARAKRREAEALGLEDDVMMMDVDAKEDCIGDAGIGGLAICA
ncbi:hypothetical protein F5Y14DRAFT_422552 [Nemania sp. NC0429]|nr:hypothetical protein F5Y14DRAFT_422552 [Nemania sp. NC0429]